MPTARKRHKAPRKAVKTAHRAGGSSRAAARAAKKNGRAAVRTHPAKPAAKPVAKRPAAKAPAPKAPLAPVALPEPAPPTQAPKKFQKEYRRWRDLLIGLRHRLLREGTHLEEEGLKALEQEVSVDHMADYGSDSYEQETTLQLIETNSLSLRDVDDALKRIEVGSYGLCEDCEQLVPTARLEVLPHARYCIDCQSKREGPGA